MLDQVSTVYIMSVIQSKILSIKTYSRAMGYLQEIPQVWHVSNEYAIDINSYTHIRGSKMAEQINRSEVQSPAATSCAAVNRYIQTHEVCFKCLLPRLLDEMLNRGPKSIAQLTQTLSFQSQSVNKTPWYCSLAESNFSCRTNASIVNHSKKLPLQVQHSLCLFKFQASPNDLSWQNF